MKYRYQLCYKVKMLYRYGFLFLFLLSSFPLAASTILSGLVLDPQRAPIAGATVELRNEAKQIVGSVRTDQTGRFLFDKLTPSIYSLQVSSTSFQTALKDGLLLQPNAPPQQIEFELRLESAASSIQVLDVPERSAASKLAIPLRELPVTVNTTSAEQMRQQGNADLVSALRYTANMHTRTHFGMYEHFTVRGFGDVVQMVDGIRQEDRRFNTQLVNVEQVEVVKGPAAALYGNSALGGLLNVVRKKPRNQHAAEANLSGGKWDNRRASLGITGPLWADKLLYRLDYGFVDFQGFRNAPTRQHLVAPVILFRPTSRDQLSINYQYNNDRFATDGGIPTVNNAIPNIPLNFRFNPPQDRALTTDNFLQAYYNRNLNEAWELRNVFSFRRFNDDYLSAESLGFAAPNSVTRSLFYFDRYRTTTLNQIEISGRFSTGPLRHYFLGGFEYQRFAQEDSNSNLTGLRLSPISLTAPFETQAPYPANVLNRTRFITQTVNAFYLQDQLQFTSKLKALLSFRHDPWRRRFRTDNFNLAADTRTPGAETRLSQDAPTGRAGLVYQAKPFLSVFGSFSSAFTPVLSVPVDGSILSPETGRQYEAGTRIDFWKNRFRLDTSLFRLEKENVVIGLGGGRFTQAGKQRSQGVEVSLEGSITPRWFVRTGYGLTDAKFLNFFSGRDLTGRVPALVPRNSGNFWTTYQLTPSLALAGGVRAMSLAYTSFFNTTAMPGYAVADASILYYTRYVDFVATFQNLANRQRYFTGAVFNTQVYPGTPFGLILSARLKWRRQS